MMQRKLNAFVLSSLFALSAMTAAPVQAKQGQQHLILPFSSAIDFYLDKLTAPIYVPKATKMSSTDVNKIALNLGLASTDSIIAIKNQDKKMFQDNAELIYEYAKSLNIKKNVLDIYPEIKKALDKNDYAALDKLVKDMRDQLVEEMNQSFRKDQAILAYTAGWVEGLYIMSHSIESQYSPKKANLLRRKALVVDLTERLKALRPEVKKRTDVQNVIRALPRMIVIMNDPVLTKAQVTEIKKISLTLRQGFLKP